MFGATAIACYRLLFDRCYFHLNSRQLGAFGLGWLGKYRTVVSDYNFTRFLECHLRR